MLFCFRGWKTWRDLYMSIESLYFVGIYCKTGAQCDWRCNLNGLNLFNYLDLKYTVLHFNCPAPLALDINVAEKYLLGFLGFNFTSSTLQLKSMVCCLPLLPFLSRTWRSAPSLSSVFIVEVWPSWKIHGNEEAEVIYTVTYSSVFLNLEPWNQSSGSLSKAVAM